VYLRDKSEIKYNSNVISLKFIYILTTGESWYNSVGLKEVNYDKNKKILESFIKKYDLNDLIHHPDHKYFGIDIDDLIKKIISGMNFFKEKINNENSISIQQFFIDLRQKIKNNISLTSIDQYSYLYFLNENTYNLMYYYKKLKTIIEEKTLLTTTTFSKSITTSTYQDKGLFEKNKKKQKKKQRNKETKKQRKQEK